MTPQYIKGYVSVESGIVGGESTMYAFVPVPVFLTVDAVNNALSTELGKIYLQERTISPSAPNLFDYIDTLLLLVCKDQPSLTLFEDALDNDSLINKTDETIEQIEDKLENGNGHESYLCTVKMQQQNNGSVAVLTILAYLKP